MRRPTLQALLRARAHTLLARLAMEERETGGAAVQVQIGDDKWIVRLSVEPVNYLAGLSDVERALFDAATAESMTAKALVRRAGYQSNSYSAAAITKLVRMGLLRRENDGGLRLG